MSSSRSTYSVEIEAVAWESIMRLGAKLQERVLTAIEALEADPRHGGVIRLQGYANLYRVRVGDYRIIYEIQDDVLVVVVVQVGNRREVYR